MVGELTFVSIVLLLRQAEVAIEAAALGNTFSSAAAGVLTFCEATIKDAAVGRIVPKVKRCLL